MGKLNSSSLYDKLYTKSRDNGRFKNLMDYITDDRNIRTAYSLFYKTEIHPSTIKEIQDKIRQVDISIEGDTLKSYIGIDSKVRVRYNNTNMDLVYQYCFRNILYPIFEAKYHHTNFGYRNVRNFKHAVANIAQRLNLGKLHWVSSINLDNLVIDPNVLCRILYNHGIEDSKLIYTLKEISRNLSRYNILKPLLVNIYLTEFDWWFSNQWDTIKGHDDEKYKKKSDFIKALRKRKETLKRGYYIRYGEDIMLFAEDKDNLTRWNYACEEFFKIRLKTDVLITSKNLRKSRIDFMGMSFWVAKKSNKWIMFSDISNESVERITEQVRKLIKITSQIRTGRAIKVYNRNIKRIHNYYGITTYGNRSFNRIWNRTRGMYYNRMGDMSQVKQLRSVIQSIKNDPYKQEISRYKTYDIKVNTIDGIPMIPICCVIHEKPMNVKFETSPFNYLNSK